MKTKLKSILAIALCAIGLSAFAESLVVAQFIQGGVVTGEFATAEAAVAALDDAKYKDIEEFRIGLVADTEFDFGGRTNRVVIGNVSNVENTLKNVLLACDGDYVVTGMVGTVVFGEGVRIEKETGFSPFTLKLIIKDGLYKSDPSYYCEEGYVGARRCDANPSLNGLYAILPKAGIAVTVSKCPVTTHYATLQDAFNLSIGGDQEVTLRLFNNLELGTAVTKLEGNKVIRLLPGESGANTITRNGEEPVIEIGREAKLAISNVVFNGANVPSENPMIEVAGKDKPTLQGKFGWLIACDGFVVSNAVGGAVHVGSGGKFELDGVAKIIDNTTDGKPKNVVIEDSAAIQLTACGAVTNGNYAQIGVWSDKPQLMVAGRQFGTVDTHSVHATDFADGDISVAKPWVGFINDLDGSLHHAVGAKIAAAGDKTYKRWVGGEYKVTLEEGDHLISRKKSPASGSPELVWTARQDAPADQPAPAILDWTDTTLTLAVSNGCDYALVTSDSTATNWVSVVGTNACEFARPAGTDYLCLRRYSITPSNIVSAATAYSVRVAAGTEDDPWTVGAENPEDVKAWTNGNEFVVSGDGTVSDLSKLASKVTVGQLTIMDATVTVAASDAFQGFGTEAVPVELTLPGGWQGELPSEGNWYGALIDMDNFVVPLAVKNVTFQQRYPWNGKVDIGFGVTGPVGETNVVVTAYTNGTVKIASYVAAVTIPASGVLATNLVWDATTAGLAANFKSDDVTVEVKIDESDIAAKSAAGALDLTVGDRVAKAVETLVVDPAWGNATAATVAIDGEASARTYSSASNDTWDTTELTPGRYTLALTAGDVNESVAFWKTGDDWVVFNSSNITADVTFEAGKTYLFFGTNTVDATLKVKDGAKFAYDKGAPAGFLGGNLEMPRRYRQEAVEGDLYRIVEAIKGCADNPWVVGEGVTAYTNGSELVIGGAGTVGALSSVDGLKDLLAGLTAINVTSNGVTGAEAQAFADVGTAGGSVLLALPDGWQGELPGEGGNWYGAQIDMDNFVYPLTVKNVTFQQRYPWNGKVDIGFGVTGPAGEKSVVITVRNGETEVKNFTVAVTIPADGVFATNLVWDADAAGLGVDFTSDAVTVEVKIDESDIAAKSEAGTVDLRDDVLLDEGAVTVAGVGYSDTAWGTEPEAKVTLGWTNETTGATGVIATGLEREGAVEVDLPKQNGDYKLTHSTGGLTSIVKFTVKGYPLGCETNPWKVGPEEDPERTVAWTDGNSNVYFKPARSAVSREGLDAVTNAMGCADFEAKLIAADGSETNDLVMVLGASGTVYDTIADALAADEASCTLFEVKGYFVSYDGNGAAGTMATDTFVPTVPTNLTANAYSAVGCLFAGWTTNGCDEVAYEDGESGVDFAEPGETLALRAKWVVDPAGVKPANYVELTNLIAQATLPVTLTIEGDIALAPGDGIVIPDGKDVSFDGEGKFDVSGIVPQFGESVTVGEGLAEGDLDRFDAKGVSKPVFEDGKVGLVARGETEDFPWVVDEENGVTAWVDEALTNLAAVVIDNGMPAATNEIDLVSLTNNLAVYGYEPAKRPLNALLKVENGGETTYVMPVNWITEQGNVYKKLEEALAAGETVVVPNFVTEEIPEEIAETGKGADGNTYAAVIENMPAVGVDTPVKAISADGLLDLVTNEKVNVKLVVEPVEEACIPTDDAEALAEANTNGVADVIGYAADYVDLSLFFNEDQQSEIGEALAIHVPWAINPRQVYRVSRIHEGVAEPLPVGTENAVGGEYVEILANGFVIHAKKYSLYAIGEITQQSRIGIVVGNGSKMLGEPDPSYIATNFTVNVQGLDIEPDDIAGYCVRAKGEAAGDYAINFVCTKMPQDYDGEFAVVPGTFTIDPAAMIAAKGTVTYPKAKKNGYLKNKANASWTATPTMGCVFAGWVASDGAPECVTSNLVKFSENELRNARLTFRVGDGEQIAPTDVEATWARIDEDEIEGAALTAGGLDVTCKSYVTATASGLPSGLKFDAKKLAITGTAKKNETKTVKVSVKNASGYTWKQSFAVTVSGGAITEVVPADDLVTTGVPVMLWCDPEKGSVKGAGVYALGRDGTKKVSINATAAKGYVFAGWYLDPGFSEPAYELTASGNNKDYRQASQTITVTEPTYLFARFVEKTTKADPITHLRFNGAGYCGADASEFAETETWYQGVALPTNGCAVAFGSASLPTVTVSGLPSGVKFDKAAQRFTGVPTAASTEKKPFFTVKISVKNASGATDVLTKRVTVEPLPAWAVGNFDGYHMEDGTTNGTFTATVGKTGKVSGKTKGGWADTTFSAKSFREVRLDDDGESLVYVVDVDVKYKDPTTKKTVTVTDTLYLMENADTGLGTIGGGDADGNGCVGVQRAWDRKADATIGFEEFPAFDTKALKDPVKIPGTELTLKFGAKGKVTVGGTVYGIRASGTTYVLPVAWRSTMTNLLAQVPVYVAPTRNATGFCEVYDVKLMGGAGADDKFDTVSVAGADIVFTVDGSAGRFFRVIVTDP